MRLITFLIFGSTWLIYGIMGLFGIQLINDKYRGYDWTPTYIRCRGIAWILLAVPWIILAFFANATFFDSIINLAIFCCVCTLPALIYGIHIDKEYAKKLKEHEENK